MMSNLLSPYNIRNIGRLKLLILFLWLFPQVAQSQQEKHTFKITGQKVYEKVPIFIRGNHLTLVNVVAEYDVLTGDHLYITYFDSDNLPLEKICFLYKGKKFYLPEADNYIVSNQLVRDGIQCIFGKNGLLESEMIYKQGVLQQISSFYSNGTKHIMITGDDQFLNGAFKMWYPNGQLSFSGNYQNNLKEGIFESYDTSGNTVRKGIYRQGKLTEGVAVVQDLVYDTPEVPAQYKGNDSILNKILIRKSANLADVRTMDSTIQRILDLKFTIYKTGQIKEVEITNSSAPLDAEVIQTVFSKQFMDFQPAQIEGVAVNSYFSKTFYLSSKGLQVLPPKDFQKSTYVYNACPDVFGPHPEVMPEFPGGEKGLRNFLAHTIKYPKEATEGKIQGKVFVRFIILEDGSVSDIAIFKSVHPLLDAEACRVVKAMPKWIPGLQDGKPVRVMYTMPINFILE